MIHPRPHQQRTSTPSIRGTVKGDFVIFFENGLKKTDLSSILELNSKLDEV